MKTVKAESRHGQHYWKASASVTDEVNDILASLGFLWVMQRSPSSAAEKAQAGYETRPKGFKRESIEFSDENVALLEKFLKQAEVETGRDEAGKAIMEGLDVEVESITKYEPSVADVKLNDERAAYERNAQAGTLPALATKVGFAGEVGDGKKENAPVEFLRAIRTYAQEQVRKSM